MLERDFGCSEVSSRAMLRLIDEQPTLQLRAVIHTGEAILSSINEQISIGCGLLQSHCGSIPARRDRNAERYRFHPVRSDSGLGVTPDGGQLECQGFASGGVASLNHRLPAENPSG